MGTDVLQQWARDHRGALDDLKRRLAEANPAHPGSGESEAAVLNRIRLEASGAGVFLWRNNSGVATDSTGRPVRYGLANDSPQLNKVFKSSDLIGIRPVTITPGHVGSVIGQFIAREVKRGDWRYTGSQREEAQAAFLALINSCGGDAQFVNDTGSLRTESLDR